jgi:hypothetical protein
MICPSCHTTDVARCCVIYAQGTSSATSQATGSSYIPGLGFDQTTIYGSVSSSTSLAKVVAPPERPRLREVGCLTLIAAVVLGVPVHYVIRWIEGWFGFSEGPWDLLALAPGLLAAPFFVVLHVISRQAYQREIQQWGATWVCLRCGHRWIPEGKSE